MAKAASKSKKVSNTISAGKVVLVTGGIATVGIVAFMALNKNIRDFFKSKLSKSEGDDSDKPVSNSYAAGSAKTKKKKKATNTAPVVQSVPTPVVLSNPREVAELVRRSTYNIRGKEQAQFNLAIQALRMISNVSQYEQANREYLKIGFVSRTIVSHLLETFGKWNAYRVQLTNEFLRIGLKGNKNEKGEVIWSLSGLDGSLSQQGKAVISTAPMRGRTVDGKLTDTIPAGETFHEIGRTEGNYSFVVTQNNKKLILPSLALKYM